MEGQSPPQVEKAHGGRQENAEFQGSSARTVRLRLVPRMLRGKKALIAFGCAFNGSRQMAAPEALGSRSDGNVGL